MPKQIKINVEDHKLIDNKKVCEDITSVTLPTFEHPTTTIENVSGMTMDLDVPNTSRYKAAEISVAHNNGVNCELLQTPGKHVMEFRVARQVFNNKESDMGHEGFKVRVTALFKSVEKGNIEKGNPWGSTVKYSILRYEEIVNGVQTMLVTATGGKLVVNGQSFYDDIEALLK